MEHWIKAAAIAAGFALAGNAGADHQVVEGEHPFADWGEMAEWDMRRIGLALGATRASAREELHGDSPSSDGFIDRCVNVNWDSGEGKMVPYDVWHRMTESDIDEFRAGFISACCMATGKDACARWLRSIGVQVEDPPPDYILLSPSE